MQPIIRPKLMIIGHARHGKDTVSAMISSTFGFTFQSSSEFVAERLVFPLLKARYNYSSVEECFNDRGNCRKEWFNIISDYCKDDRARLGREIFANNDIYCGLRNKSEFHALRNEAAFDICIWVDRSDILPTESQSSMNLEPWMADYIIDNNSSLEHLKFEVNRLMPRILRTV
jgi:dephospho-CoA kinase